MSIDTTDILTLSGRKMGINLLADHMADSASQFAVIAGGVARNLDAIIDSLARIKKLGAIDFEFRQIGVVVMALQAVSC